METSYTYIASFHGIFFTISLYPLHKTITHVPKEIASPQPLNTDLAQEQTCAKNRNYPFSCIISCSLRSGGGEPEFSLSDPGSLLVNKTHLKSQCSGPLPLLDFPNILVPKPGRVTWPSLSNYHTSRPTARLGGTIEDTRQSYSLGCSEGPSRSWW